MPEEFWIIGIIKNYHKRIKGNLWTIALDKKTAKHVMVRLTTDIDPSFLAFKYDSRYKAELTMATMWNQKFQHRYKFCLLHFKDGKFLDDSIQENNKQEK